MTELPKNNADGYAGDGSHNNTSHDSGSAHMTNDLMHYESRILIVTPPNAPQQSSSMSDSVFESGRKSRSQKSPYSAPGDLQQQQQQQQQQINSSTGETQTPSSSNPTPGGDGGDECSENGAAKTRGNKQASKASSIKHPIFAHVEPTSLGTGTASNPAASKKSVGVGIVEESSTNDSVFLPPGHNNMAWKKPGEKKVVPVVSPYYDDPFDSEHLSKIIERKKPLKKANSNIDVPNFQRTPLPLMALPLNHSTPYFEETPQLMKSLPKIREDATEFDLGDHIALNKVDQADIGQLRELITQVVWAKESLKTVQKKYFDKQRQAMINGWRELDDAIEEFHRNKNEENAKIASIRNNLAEEKRKYSAKNEEKLIKELEAEVKKGKNLDTQKTRLISELRAKITGLEGTNKANEEAAQNNIRKLKEMQSRLTKSEMENSNLRVKLAMLKEKTAFENSEQNISRATLSANRSSANSSALISRRSILGTPKYHRSHSTSSLNRDVGEQDGARPKSADLLSKTVRWSSPLASSHSISGFDESFMLPTSSGRSRNSDMVNTKFETTTRGMEYTFSNGPSVTVFTELNCRCTLYEYNNRDFRWIGAVSGAKIQVYYNHFGKVYDIRTSTENKILFFLNGQLEIHWKGGDKTVFLADGKRIEMFYLDSGEGIRFEMFEEEGNLQWGTNQEPEELISNPEVMSRRKNGTYATSIEGNSTQVNSPDLVLRRMKNEGFTRIVFRDIQLSFCVDNVFVAKHVVKGSEGMINRPKNLCFSSGSCAHMRG